MTSEREMRLMHEIDVLKIKISVAKEALLAVKEYFTDNPENIKNIDPELAVSESLNKLEQ